MTRSSKRIPTAMQQIRFLNGVVDPSFAVHAHHAEVQRIVGREAADAEQSHGDGNVAGADELLERVHGAGNHDAVAGENERALCRVEKLARRDRTPLFRDWHAGASAEAFGAEASQSNSAVACCASLVMSTRTGPGRPHAGDHEGFADGARDVFRPRVTTTLCFVMGMVMPVMSIS